MSKITTKMKEFLKDNENLLQIDPTKFLISTESSNSPIFDIPDIISFIEIFDESGIKFDINQLFKSSDWDFIDNYIKKGISLNEIESLFYNNILKNPILNNIVTEIPSHLFKNLNNDDIRRAIKNTMLSYSIGNILGEVERIFILASLDTSTYKILISIIVKSAKYAAYNYIETMGVWIPNYGFMINKDKFFKKVKEISESLLESLQLINGD